MCRFPCGLLCTATKRAPTALALVICRGIPSGTFLILDMEELGKAGTVASISAAGRLIGTEHTGH